jgi:hypothetical protein
MAADKKRVADTARAPFGPAFEGLRFVRSRKHNPAANRDGLTAQRRVKHLLDRGIKRVQVRMARHISSGRSLHRSNPQRREARRPAGAYVTAEIEKWGKVIRAANIKPE